MARSPPIEIIGPDDHAYNDDGHTPLSFLQAVMRDSRLPLSIRMDAAAKCAVFVHPRLAQVSQETSGGLVIKIEGGLPPLPGTNIIMPGDEPLYKDPSAVLNHPAKKPNGDDRE